MIGGTRYSSPTTMAEFRDKISVANTSSERVARGLVADVTARISATPASISSCCTLYDGESE